MSNDQNLNTVQKVDTKKKRVRKTPDAIRLEMELKIARIDLGESIKEFRASPSQESLEQLYSVASQYVDNINHIEKTVKGGVNLLNSAS